MGAKRWRVSTMAPLVMVAAIGLAACGSGEPATQADPQLELGRTVFAKRCASCHGAKGGGSIGLPSMR